MKIIYYVSFLHIASAVSGNYTKFQIPPHQKYVSLESLSRSNNGNLDSYRRNGVSEVPDCTTIVVPEQPIMSSQKRKALCLTATVGTLVLMGASALIFYN